MLDFGAVGAGKCRLFSCSRACAWLTVCPATPAQQPHAVATLSRPVFSAAHPRSPMGVHEGDWERASVLVCAENLEIQQVRTKQLWN